MGTGCGKCKMLYKAAEEAVKELGADVQLSKEEDILEILKYKVMGLPGLVIDGELVSQGETLSVEQIKKLIKK